MTATVLSLLSIILGIFGAWVTKYLTLRSTLGWTGCTIVGVFGSAIVTKIISRLGIGPYDLLKEDDISIPLLALYLCFSIVAGCGTVIMVDRLMGKQPEK